MRVNTVSILSYPSFKRQTKKLQESKIDAEKIRVVSDTNESISTREKVMLVDKILEAHEHALKNYNYGNIAKAGYATNIQLSDGSWHLATNFNNTRNDISAVCGERSAVLVAYNDLLKNKEPIEQSQKDSLGFKVKYLAMSSYKEPGSDKNAASPCAECLSWLNTTRYFDDDTKIASLEKDEQTGETYLKISSLKQYLPLRKEINVIPDVHVNQLPFNITKEALDAIKKKGLRDYDIKNILSKTQETYKKNKLAQTSEYNGAAGVFANNEIFNAAKIDFSKRWYVEPMQYAAAKAIEKYGSETKIDAICCLGNSLLTDTNGITHNDGVVNLKTLGALRTKYADNDTLVITTTRNAVNIRTIGNYMPDKFKFTQAYNIK